MGKLATAKRLFKEGPRSFICAIYDNLRYLDIFKALSDKQFIKITYWIHFGKRLNLENPQTFNEKLQWLKIHNRKPIYNIMVDKCAVKQYVANVIGDEYITKNYGSWNSFNEIDFSKLPDRFVLKCNHDSGSVCFCREKKSFDLNRAQYILSRGLRKNLYYWGREWPYKDVKPCVFAECFLEDTADGDLKDYKLFCFNGKVKCFKIDFGRFTDHHANYYDCQGKLLPISELVCPSKKNHILRIPSSLSTMIELAEKLSADQPFLRVDFYNVEDRIYFGELTFYPASGLSPFTDMKADYLLGSWIDLNILK